MVIFYPILLAANSRAWSFPYSCSFDAIGLSYVILFSDRDRGHVLRLGALLSNASEQLCSWSRRLFDQALHWPVDSGHRLFHRTSRSKDLRARSLSVDDHAGASGS